MPFLPIFLPIFTVICNSHTTACVILSYIIPEWLERQKMAILLCLSTDSPYLGTNVLTQMSKRRPNCRGAQGRV